MSVKRTVAVWFPTVRTNTGTDVFTERLVAGLVERGVRAEITWLPLRAEYAPWTVPVPTRPPWACVAHVNTWLHPRFLPKDLPVVATLHHSTHNPALRPYKGRIRAAYHRWWIAPNERRVMCRASRVVAVSSFAAELAQRTLLRLPIKVIHNGIDTECFRPGKRVHKCGEPFRLLYVGSWAALKGAGLLAPIMRELGPGFELRYTSDPAAKVDRSTMPGNTRGLGRLRSEGVVAAMQNVDALLFPSRSEGFGLVVAEAMACGLPVIATCGSSLTEVVEDGVTGILCPEGDIAAFATAARALAADPDRAAEMSTAARAACVRHFGIDGMIQAYLDIYQSLDKV